MWLCDIKSLQNGCIQAAPSQSRNRQIRLVLAGFVGQTGLSHIPGSVSRPGGLERAPEGCCLPHSYPTGRVKRLRGQSQDEHCNDRVAPGLGSRS